MPPQTVRMVDPDGGAHDVPLDQVKAAFDAQFHLESDDEKDSRLGAQAAEGLYGGVAGGAAAGVAGFLRGATLGGSDLIMGAAGGGDSLRDLKTVNPGISTGTEIAGMIATAIPSGGGSFLARTPAGAAVKLGARIAETGEGASVAAKLGRGFAGGATEGFLFGAGQGVSELVMDTQPLNMERAASVIGSHALFGAATGGAVGAGVKGVEIGLGRARRAIDEFAASRRAGASIPEDLAAMDAKQLRVARDVEKEAIDTAHKAEREAVESNYKATLERLEVERVPQRAQLADDIATFRREVKEANQFLTTQDVKLKAAEGKLATSEISKISKDANQQLDRILRDPKGLAENPALALKTLRQQENAFEKLLQREDELRAAFAKDTTGVRAAALDTVQGTLEKNRALQARIGELGPVKLEKPALPVKPSTSTRLTEIENAEATLSAAGGQGKTVAEQMAQGAAFGVITGGIAALPIPGAAFAAPFIGAKASKFISEKLFGQLGKATSASSTRGAVAVSKFLGKAEAGAKKGAAIAPPIATRVLSGVRFAPAKADEQPAKKGAPASLADLYAARSEEVRSQTMYDAAGRAMIRPEARVAVAEQLKGIAAVNLLLADHMETVAVRRIELLANALPKRPDVAGMQLGGTDLWRPSDMEMRAWARLVAAVEDPDGVLERAHAGMVTPEDAQAMRQVYPEMLADFTQQVIAELPALRQRLPYQRRVALSVLTGVPVDPALDPRIMKVLQQQYEAEEGSEGGMQAPLAAPQYGSLGTASKKADGERTPAQRRSA